jgi:hypothetical protein
LSRIDDAHGGERTVEPSDLSRPNPKKPKVARIPNKIAAAWGRVVDARRPTAFAPRLQRKDPGTDNAAKPLPLPLNPRYLKLNTA